MGLGNLVERATAYRACYQLSHVPWSAACCLAWARHRSIPTACAQRARVVQWPHAGPCDCIDEQLLHVRAGRCSAPADPADDPHRLAAHVHAAGRCGAAGGAALGAAAPQPRQHHPQRRRGRPATGEDPHHAPSPADGVGHDAGFRRYQLLRLAVYRVAARLPRNGAAHVPGEERLGGGHPVPCRRVRHAQQRSLPSTGLRGAEHPSPWCIGCN